MPQGGGKSRGRTTGKRRRQLDDHAGRRRGKATQLPAKKRKKKLKKGNPVRTAKKSGYFQQHAAGKKKISANIHNNIEALMAAKVIQNHGTFSLKDLKVVGKERKKGLEKLRLEKEKKRRRNYVKPEKVNIPRI